MRRTGTDSGEFSPVARLTLKQAPTCTLLNTLRNSLLFFKYMIPLRSQQVSYTVVLPVNFDFITYHLSLSLRDESVTNLPNFVIRMGTFYTTHKTSHYYAFHGVPVPHTFDPPSAVRFRSLLAKMQSLHTVVYHGAIPVLGSQFIEISYIDLAEQTFRVSLIFSPRKESNLTNIVDHEKNL